MELGDALAWLDGHQNLERMLADRRTADPDLARMRHLVDVLGHPERSAPAVHVTGTNGKTSTSRALTAIFNAKGLSVGTYTSPHLESISERISVDGVPIADPELAAVLSDLAALEPLAGVRATWFELLTAAAFRYFSDRPVDVMVVEVGLGGRFDATNVLDAPVAVVTNVGLDHVELLGPTRAHIAGEKAGIVVPGSTLVLGERDPALYDVFDREAPERLWWAGRDYEVTDNRVAVGGRALDLRTPEATYEGVWLGVRGRFQGDNFAAALAAAEAFFDAPVEEPLVRQAAGAIRAPGRLEVMSSSPLVVIDGAKNVEGASSSAVAVGEEFPGARSVVLVVGMLGGKDPALMLAAMGVGAASSAGRPPVRLVVACQPPSPRAQPASVIADAARAAGVDAEEAPGVREALELAVARAHEDDLVLVTGSLYVVGAARAALAH